MSIDWSKAPKDATHWEPNGTEFGEGWMKKVGNQWFYWGEGDNKWFHGKLSCNVSAEREATFEPRPQDPWNGQGLPPVGTVCEYRCHDSCEPNDWTAVHVLAHAAHGSDTAMLLAEDDNGEPGTMYGRIWVPGTCRPLRTPEQIAAEERAKAIEEMCFAVETLTVKQAKALFDAGYRRHEEGK
ncbi:hypothetical protein [Pseudomonas aeruginosa]|uniref:Uncharacterized protein n=1 Tax=Pseudomonas fluorescens TaxID=294 RepID=A0A448BK92_PSEFL|nr:hypothetical protein [Pseudomonas aeruginosa]VEE45713.1 Uncharacterised protein [Pseudomonas fluorescens]HBN9854789.1 hypothetical protein [Pseudomonas aeruginosa]HBN9880251.1 hypothetical protein [Pseudomonas aeruginosa]